MLRSVNPKGTTLVRSVNVKGTTLGFTGLSQSFDVLSLCLCVVTKEGKAIPCRRQVQGRNMTPMQEV